MPRLIIIFCLFLVSIASRGQDRMTPELLWKLKRVSGIGVTNDRQSIVYSVRTPDAAQNKSASATYKIPVQGGPEEAWQESVSSFVADRSVSPDGKFKVTIKSVKINKVSGKDFYPGLDKSNVKIYDGLAFRHWDTWEDGEFNHLFVHSVTDGKADEGKDIMANEAYDSPQQPFGGDEDFTWSPDSRRIIYVSKKKAGTAYAVSTNTDLYEYTVATGATVNLTGGMMGYDNQPLFSPSGALAWLSMKRDGYEADKNDIIVRSGTSTTNLTEEWDGTVNGFVWSDDGKKIYFNAPVDGTIQLFEVDYSGSTKKIPGVRQITKGDFDVASLVGQSGTSMIVTRTDMNHAAEIYSVNLVNGEMKQVTHVNDAVFNKLALSKIEKRMIPTTDGKLMLVWVIYPPDFNATKKYPALLYCQGGPQSPLTQFYSYRWNLQLMAANGYVVVAPNRRGMQGHGVAWNEQISKDHGGQAINDYLSAIDAVSKEPFVDKSRLGCVGASYGGYSVFYLAGMHNKRFKTFISHDGIFDLKSMYGSTEELFFVDWDYGGNYWDKNNAAAQKTYTKFDPSNLVDKWDTPILIYQGGKDYRVPDGQGFEAFTAAQLRGIKSRLIYLPDESHWVLTAQNALVWQNEFFKWLKETL